MSSHTHACPICQKSIVDASNLHYHMKYCVRKIKIRHINSHDVGIEVSFCFTPHIPYLTIQGRDKSRQGIYRDAVLIGHRRPRTERKLFSWRPKND